MGFFWNFYFLFFYLYFININSDKNEFLTHHSYFKVHWNIQGQIQVIKKVIYKEKSQKKKKKQKPISGGFFMFRFGLFGLGFVVPTLASRELRDDYPNFSNK